VININIGIASAIPKKYWYCNPFLKFVLVLPILLKVVLTTLVSADKSAELRCQGGLENCFEKN